jgi:hypothetical protein
LKRTTLMVAGIALAAALVVGGTTASATSHHNARIAPAKVTQLHKLSRLDGQFVSLVRRVKPCAGSAAQIKAAGAIRKAALKKARKSSVRVLKAKNVKMSKAVLRLAKFAGKCGAPGSRPPVVVQPGTGSPGAPGAPGSAFANLALPDLINSVPMDVSPLLGGGILPDTINAVPLDQLLSGQCVTQGAACLGIDPTALAASLTDAVNELPLLGPILNPLLNQVLAAIGTNDLASLIHVQRISDTVIKLVPQGPLATLEALLGPVVDTVTTTVGKLQIIPAV